MLSAQVDSVSSAAVPRDQKIEAIVVAEQSAQGTKIPRPSVDHTIHYMSYDD